MIAFFSGHTIVDSGNAIGNISEHEISNMILSDLGQSGLIDYNQSVAHARYDIIKHLKRNDYSCAVILHFPASSNERINFASAVFSSCDYRSLSIAKSIEEICVKMKMVVSISDEKSSNFDGAFFMKHSPVPIVVFNPFFMSYSGVGLNQMIITTTNILRQLIVDVRHT